MTDFSTTAPITIRRFKLLRLTLPRLGLGQSLFAMAGLIGDAFKMTYVDPYTDFRRQPQIATDDGLDGRDPNW